jgi:hypothetical protein
MAERHRATSARPLNIEVENVFGMNFVDLLEFPPAPSFSIYIDPVAAKREECL